MAQKTIAGFSVDIARTRRAKTIAVQVSDDGVRVLAPRWVSEREIREVVAEKSHWIGEKLRQHAARPQPRPHAYRSGEIFAYLGADIVLDVRSGRAEGAVLDGQSLAIAIPDHGDQAAQAIAVRHQLEWWYRGEAERIFQDRATYFAQTLGLHLKSVAIKSYKARWGSCGPDGDILFDWRLVMAPLPVTTYRRGIGTARVVEYENVRGPGCLLHQIGSLGFIHITDLGIVIKIDNRCVMIDQGEPFPVQCGGRVAFAGIINGNGMGRELR